LGKAFVRPVQLCTYGLNPSAFRRHILRGRNKDPNPPGVFWHIFASYDAVSTDFSFEFFSLFWLQ
jgi:hypothetical protein